MTLPVTFALASLALLRALQDPVAAAVRLQADAPPRVRETD